MPVAEAIEAHDYDTAMELRGSSFRKPFETLQTMLRALPHPPQPGQRRLRLAVHACRRARPRDEHRRPRRRAHRPGQRPHHAGRRRTASRA